MDIKSGKSCNRLHALDMLRGLAVAGMILVVSPGSWGHQYSQLGHAAWNGATVADMVFPTFLFGVGMAWGLGFPRTSDRQTWGRVLRRTILLAALGLFLNALPYFDLAHVRIPGILQRIALCYLLTAALTLLTGRRDSEGMRQINVAAVAIATVGLVLGYWAILTFASVPGHGAGSLDSAWNFPAWVDRSLFTVDHLWPYGTTEGMGVTYDPEGVLSTLGALVNVLLGVLAACLYRMAPSKAALRFGIAAVALIAAGLLLDPLLPINKRIWTSSFALLSSGFSLAVLASLIFMPASRALSMLSWPVRVLGANAILAFTLSQLLGVFSALPIVPARGGTVSPQQWGYEVAGSVIGEPYLASLACALGILALIVVVIAPLDRRSIYLRL